MMMSSSMSSRGYRVLRDDIWQIPNSRQHTK